MYHIKKDQRSERSAEEIYAALAQLIQQKSFDAIKVSEVVTLAQVGRATFYRNFDAIEDVLQWRCDEVVKALLIHLAQNRETNGIDAQVPLLKPVLHFFDGHSDLIKLLLQAKRVDIFQTTLQATIENTVPLHPAFSAVPEKYRGYIAGFRASVVTSILSRWIQNGKQEDPNELAETIVNLTTRMNGMRTLY